MLTLTSILAPVGGGSSVQPFTNTITTSAAVGDTLIVLFVSSASGTLNAPTDSPGNTYVVQNQASASTNLRVGLATCLVTKPIVGGSSTISVNTSGSSFKGVAVSKIINTPGYWNLTVDKAVSSSTQTTATPATSASGVLVYNHELLIAAYGWNSADTFAVPTGYTNPDGAGSKITTSSTVISAGYAYLEVSSSATSNPTCTLGASVSSCGTLATFNTGRLFMNNNNYNFAIAGEGDGMSSTERIR